jgi:uncharacterized protein (DUF1684 family)
MSGMSSFYARLDIADWRRRIAALYAAVRRPDEPIEIRHARFWAGRDELFRGHPASPLEPGARADFEGVARWPYDPRLRFEVEPEPIEAADTIHARLRDDGELRMTPTAYVPFQVGDAECRLTVYALGGYGGGLFLPFRDATSGNSTYGGGRYLLDTAKHADLGEAADPDGSRRLVLDFNFSYHPSCVYSPRWDCPLAPPGNRLDVAMYGGEASSDAYGT